MCTTALNMLILFRLLNLDHMEGVIATMELSIQWQRVIFSPLNEDTGFVRGLCHCLLQVEYGLSC